MEGLLDVNGGDVVRQQQELVGVQLLPVLPEQVGVLDQLRGLQQPDKEDTGSRERIEDMDALIRQAPAELLPQDVVGAVQDEVHDLHRRVHDPQPVGLLLQCDGEELLVKLHQHPLPGFAVVQALCPQANAAVEGLEIPSLVLQTELLEVPRQAVERPGHRVAAGEVVVLEQGLEHGPRQQVLGQHPHRVSALDLVVDRYLEFIDEKAEPLPERVVRTRVQRTLDP